MLVIILIFMMTVTLTYSAPTVNIPVSSNSTNSSTSTSDKPILRYQDDTPGKCCTDPSKKCCPYDFDDKKCENTDSRTLCGYDKNQKIPDSSPVFVTKQGLDCRVIEERLECGYDKGHPVPDSEPVKLIKIVNKQSQSDCCQCCNQKSKGLDTADDKLPPPTTPPSENLLNNKESPATQETKTTHNLSPETPVKPKSTSTKKRARRTTIECVEIHSKVACRVVRLDEELDYD